jgi:hypothetical protein
MSFSKLLEEFYRVKFGQAFLRESRNLEEVFVLFLMSDYFGIPNPLKFYVLELYPYILEEFHNWHKRMGMETSPLDWIKCC